MIIIYKSKMYWESNQFDSVEYYINKADSLLKKGFKNKGLYNEEYKEVYKSDIDYYYNRIKLFNIYK